MPRFSDNAGHEWVISFDGLKLAELREAHGLNLADITGDTYVTLETDQAELTKVVLFICGSQMQGESVSKAQLANLLVGEVAEAAMAAIWGAAKLFFRPKLWSALQCAYELRIQQAQNWERIAPVMQMLNQPDMPEAMKQAVMAQLANMMDAMSGGSQRSKEQPSATGLDDARSTPVSEPPAPAESAQAA